MVVKGVTSINVEKTQVRMSINTIFTNLYIWKNSITHKHAKNHTNPYNQAEVSNNFEFFGEKTFKDLSLEKRIQMNRLKPRKLAKHV